MSTDYAPLKKIRIIDLIDGRLEEFGVREHVDPSETNDKHKYAKQPHGPPMTLGNMRELGVQNLIASCLDDACRHVALIDVSAYTADTEVPSFRSRVVCAKCCSRGNKIDVRPNWKEQPTRPTVLRYDEPR